jgi:hypothetical protein
MDGGFGSPEMRTLDLPQQNQLLYAGLSQTKIADFLLHATTIS